MKKKIKDRHLDIPSEANRDKHINFVAIENNEIDPSLLPSNGPLTAGEEDREFKENGKKKKKKD